MNYKKIQFFSLIIFILSISFVSAIPQKDIYYKNYYSLFDIYNLTSRFIYVNNSPVCTPANGLCVGVGANSSWNQGLADTLYAPIGSVGGDNTSWNESYARTIFALIGSGGNSSWNESRANSLYVTLGTKLGNTSTEIMNVANSSGYIKNWNTSGFIINQTIGLISYNTSWNESRAYTQFLNRTSEANYLSTYNATYDAKISYNTSWNESRADSKYALIGSGGNASWNESRANNLYIKRTGDNFTGNFNNTGNFYATSFCFQNGTCLGTGGTSETDPVWTSDKINYVTYTALDNASIIRNSNTSWIMATANSSGYIKNWNSSGFIRDQTSGIISYNNTWNESRANALYVTLGTKLGNTSAEIIGVANSSGFIKNWNASGYITNWNTSGFIINWNASGFIRNQTSGIISYNNTWNESYARTIFAVIGSGSDNNTWNQSLANTLYASHQNVVDNISYHQTNFKHGNTSAEIIGVANSSGFIKNWNSSGYITNWNTSGFIINQTIGIISYNTSWNESKADSKYALIGSGGNASWNESRANSLYVAIGTKLGNTSAEIIGVANSSGFIKNWNASGYITNWNSSGFIINQTIGFVSDNSTWNENRAFTLFLNRTSEASYLSTYNATYDAKISYNTSWNESRADSKYALIGSGGNASWNESRANSLYVTLGTKLGNTSAEIIGVANSSGYIKNWNSSGFIINQTIGLVSYNNTWNQSLANTLYASISVITDNRSWNQSLANSLYYLITNPNNFINLSNLTNYYTKTEVNTLGNYSLDKSQIAFKNESNNFIKNQTVTGIIFNLSTTHTIMENTSCIIIKGDTSTLEVC